MRLTARALAVLLAAGLLLGVGASPSTPLLVRSARAEPNWKYGGANGIAEGDAVAAYKFLINVNDAGDALFEGPACDPAAAGYPADCPWPSIKSLRSHAPIYTSGDQNDWNASQGLAITAPGKYLVSVLADGFKLCGAHFEVPDASGAPISVWCQPHPLPLGTLRAFVFLDNKPMNGVYDGPHELGLPDAGVVIKDMSGPVEADYFGNDITGIVSDARGMIEVHRAPPVRRWERVRNPCALAAGAQHAAGAVQRRDWRARRRLRQHQCARG